MGKVPQSLLRIGANVCRLILALSFLLAGTVKLIDPRGTQYKIEDYGIAFGVSDYMPLFVPLCLAVALAMTEFVLGIYLLFGIRRRSTSFGVLLFMLVMTPLTLYLALANPVADCGCFGDAIYLTNWQTFWKNLVLLLASMVIVWRPRLMKRIITERNQWTVSLYSIVFALILAGYCIYRLPVIDFRPYRIGVDLPRAIEAEWEGRSTDLKYADFSIQSLTGEDLTLSWLQQPGYKFLMVAPYLDTADDAAMDRLNDLYDYARQQGYPFLCLTSSVEERIERWKDLTGAEYPFAWTDGIVLKTMIRSNPGLILLKDGVIVNKWPNTALPGYEELTAPLHELPLGQSVPKGYARRALILLLWFAIPLSCFTLLDGLWVGSKYYKRYKIRKTNLIKNNEQ